MDFDRVAWFMTGLIIGNLLETYTTVVLLSIWIVARNQALPIYLGGYYPQDLLANLFATVNLWLALIPFLKKKIPKDQGRGQIDKQSTDIQIGSSDTTSTSSNHLPAIEGINPDHHSGEIISTFDTRQLNFQVIPVDSRPPFSITQSQFGFPSGGVQIVTPKPLQTRQSFIIRPRPARIEIVDP